MKEIEIEVRTARVANVLKRVVNEHCPIESLRYETVEDPEKPTVFDYMAAIHILEDYEDEGKLIIEVNGECG